MVGRQPRHDGGPPGATPRGFGPGFRGMGSGLPSPGGRPGENGNSPLRSHPNAVRADTMPMVTTQNRRPLGGRKEGSTAGPRRAGIVDPENWTTD